MVFQEMGLVGRRKGERGREGGIKGEREGGRKRKNMNMNILVILSLKKTAKAA